MDGPDDRGGIPESFGRPPPPAYPIPPEQPGYPGGGDGGPGSDRRAGRIWPAAAVLVAIAAVSAAAYVALGGADTDEPAATGPSPASVVPGGTSQTPTDLPRVRAITGQIPMADGAIVITSTQPADSEAPRETILVGVGSDGQVLWTQRRSDDPWYLPGATSDRGPSVLDSSIATVEMLGEGGGVVDTVTVPTSKIGAPIAYGWLGDAVLVAAGYPGPSSDPFSMKTKLSLVTAEGEVLWTEPLPQGYPEIAGGETSAFVAVGHGKGTTELHRVTSMGAGPARELRHAFVELTQVPGGVLVSGSPKNAYELLDASGEILYQGEIGYEDGWLSGASPIAEETVAIQSNGQDFGTRITMVGPDGPVGQAHVGSEDPLAVWLSSTGGIFVVGVGELAEGQRPLIGDAQIVELPWLTSSDPTP